MYHLSIKHVYKKFKNEAVLEDVNLRIFRWSYLRHYR